MREAGARGVVDFGPALGNNLAAVEDPRGQPGTRNAEAQRPRRDAESGFSALLCGPFVFSVFSAVIGPGRRGGVQDVKSLVG